MGDSSDVLRFNVSHNKSPLSLIATNIANHQLPLRMGVNSISEFYHGVYLLIKVFQFYTNSSVRNCNCVLFF